MTIADSSIVCAVTNPEPLAEFSKSATRILVTESVVWHMLGRRARLQQSQYHILQRLQMLDCVKYNVVP